MIIYRCSKCGSIVVSVKKGAVPVCCGEEMNELKANTVDAAVEKHVPVVNASGSSVTLTCGEVLHPMEEKHYIEFMVLETRLGFQIQYLKPGEEPVCHFELAKNDSFVSAYAYCNLHGLWKSDEIK